MRKNSIVIIAIAIVFVVIFVGLLNIPETARSQGAMPGSGPLKNESDAIAIARTVAGFSSTNHDPSQLILDSSKNINATEFQELLKAEGTNVDPAILKNIEPNDALSGKIWIVKFRGSFTPDRTPPGVTPSVYSIIEVFLDAQDGSVIGIHMHD